MAINLKLKFENFDKSSIENGSIDEEMDSDSDLEYTKRDNNGKKGQFCPLGDDVEALEVIVKQFTKFLELGLKHTHIKKKLIKFVKSAQKELEILKNQRHSSKNSLTFDYKNYDDFISN